jgi:hypothetical protein
VSEQKGARGGSRATWPDSERVISRRAEKLPDLGFLWREQGNEWLQWERNERSTESNQAKLNLCRLDHLCATGRERRARERARGHGFNI